MKVFAWPILILGVALTACGSTEPTVIGFDTTLSSASEVPAITASATGTALLTLNQTTKTATLTGLVSGLTGDLMMAHIHGPAAAGANADVLFTLDFTNAATTKSATLKDKATITLTDAQITDLKAGKYYVNVHTAANPKGEARGQLTQILPR